MLNQTILDEDVGYENKPLQNPIKRFGARGIIQKDGQIALLFKKSKNEYKLPGGGIENDETPEEAFVREAFEKTGCVVKIISKLGITEEIKGNSNFYQLSHIFLSEIVEDTHKLHLTEKEQAEGAKLIWVSLDEAIKLVNDCFERLKPSSYDKQENVYATRFIVKRDALILDYFKNNNKNYKN